MNAPKRHDRGMKKTSGSGAGLSTGKAKALKTGSNEIMHDQFGVPVAKTNWRTGYKK